MTAYQQLNDDSTYYNSFDSFLSSKLEEQRQGEAWQELTASELSDLIHELKDQFED